MDKADQAVVDAERALAASLAALQQARRAQSDAHTSALPPAEAPITTSGQRNNDVANDTTTPDGYEKVSEGCAAVLARKNKDGSQAVFYNPVQVVNRDLSILAIRGYNELRKEKPHKKGRAANKGLRILEALSATGLRAIRYWKEIPDVDLIIVNDLLPDAVAAIRRNILYNRVPLDKVVPNCDDAVHLMQRLSWGTSNSFAKGPDYIKFPPKPEEVKDEEPGFFWEKRKVSSGAADDLFSGEKMDVVDLDPYGTAAPFLDSAIACAEEGALLCVTCTDCDVLCGVHPEACHHKYGAITVKAKYCHELAVRVLLGCIERHANRHGKYIVPMLSLQIDFYVRVFIRVYTSKAETKLSIGKLGHVLQCSGCAAFRVKPIGMAFFLCVFCIISLQSTYQSGVVRCETHNREARRDQQREIKKQRHQERKRKREDKPEDSREAVQTETAATEKPEAEPTAAAEAEAETEGAADDVKEEERPTAALPAVPGRQEPRIKYGTATTVKFHNTLSPLTHGCNMCGRSVWVCTYVTNMEKQCTLLRCFQIRKVNIIHPA